MMCALCAATLLSVAPAWGDSDTALFDRLASPDEAARREAYQALTEALAARGPSLLEPLFDRMNPVDRTANLWAQNTARKIVHDAARPGAVKERAQVETALVRILESSTYPETIQFAIRLISRVPSEASVPALAMWLDHPRNRGMALWALESHTSERVTPVLLDALELAAESAWRAALIQTLGMRGDARAQDAVLDALNDEDACVRLAAISAAGHLPSRRTFAALWKPWDAGNKAERSAATDALLAAAEIEVPLGRRGSAAKVYRQLYKRAENPDWRAAGLAGLARSDAKEALPLLLSALQDPHPPTRGIAQTILADMPMEELGNSVEEALVQAEHSERVGAIQVLALRGGIVSNKCLTEIITTLIEARGDAREAAASALTTLPGGNTTRAVMTAMDDRSPEEQSLLLEILGARGDREALPLILAATRRENINVRIAAVGALGRFPDTESIDALEKAMLSENSDLREAAVTAVIYQIGLGGRGGDAPDTVELCVRAARVTNDPDHVKVFVDYVTAAGAADAVAELAVRRGLVVHWWVLGPIPDRMWLREHDIIDPDKPIDITQPQSAGDKPLSWRYFRVDDPAGKLDLLHQLAAEDHVGCYLYAEVSSEGEREALFKIGSDDDVFCWVNGELVHRYLGERGWAADQDVAKVHLRSGVNRIRLKVLQYVSGWEVSLRVTDLDNKPIALDQKTPE